MRAFTGTSERFPSPMDLRVGWRLTPGRLALYQGKLFACGRGRDRDPTDPHQLKSGMLSLTNFMGNFSCFLDGSEQLSGSAAQNRLEN